MPSRRTYILLCYLFISSSSLRKLPPEFTGERQTKLCHISGSQPDLEHTPSLKIEAEKRPTLNVFVRLCNLMANIFGIEVIKTKLQKISCSSKISRTLAYKRLKLGRAFYSLSVNSALCFTAGLRTRRSVNGTQPNVLGIRYPHKLGTRNWLFWTF